MMEPRKVFVYGTLLPGEPNARLLKGFDYTVAPDTVPGELYDNGAYPFAVLGEGRGEIHGAVYSFAYGDMEAVLARLDRLEGYFGLDHPRNLYDRVDIVTENGAWAWVYRTGRRRMAQVRRLPRIQGGDWRNRTERAAAW